MLVFVPERFHLSLEDEKKRYDLHQNNPSDQGYRKFLRRLFDPLSAKLVPHAKGLDFGCGPGPTLSVMFEEAGYSMNLYDPFYAPHEEVFNNTYDFIITTEVIEHLRTPLVELKKLFGCLKPGGILGLMTKLVIDQQAFQKWHYINDETHICFFSKITFQWLADTLHARIEFVGNDVIMLYKD